MALILLLVTHRIGSNRKDSFLKKTFKNAKNSVFDCHLSSVGQMAIRNSVSNYLLSMFVNNINVFDCHLSGVSPGYLLLKYPSPLIPVQVQYRYLHPLLKVQRKLNS